MLKDVIMGLERIRDISAANIEGSTIGKDAFDRIHTIAVDTLSDDFLQEGEKIDPGEKAAPGVDMATHE